MQSFVGGDHAAACLGLLLVCGVHATRGLKITLHLASCLLLALRGMCGASLSASPPLAAALYKRIVLDRGLGL